MKKILLSLFLILIIAFSSIYYYYQKKISLPFTKESKTFIVKKGDYINAVANRLSIEGLISSYALFKVHARFSQKAERIKTGTYLIPANSSIKDILDLFVSGKVLLTKVTIPEGKNLYEIGDILEKAKILKANDFIKTAKAKKSLPFYKHQIPNIEGHLYPETYRLSKGMSPKEVLSIMVQHYKKAIPDLSKNRFGLTPYEVLILASIVEKETGQAYERPRIAGVFHNRLKKKMRIQSDPTIIYGIYEKYDGNIRRKDIRTATPYNTYTVKRLPIGPIANPGIKAIKAVLEPEEHDYLYFVSKNDGTHTFSKTYKEHKRKVYEYQIRRKR